MSKKHFIQLADYIRSFNDSREQKDRFSEDQLRLLAGFCEHVNVRFNRGRWLAYIRGEQTANGKVIKPQS